MTLQQMIDALEIHVENATLPKLVGLLDNCAVNGGEADSAQLYKYWRDQHDMILRLIDMAGRTEEVDEYQLGRLRAPSFKGR